MKNETKNNIKNFEIQIFNGRNIQNPNGQNFGKSTIHLFYYHFRIGKHHNMILSFKNYDFT